MNKIEKTITINAPVHAIFEYVIEPLNLLKLCPKLVGIEDTHRLQNGGRSFKWEYKMVKVHFWGTSTCIECLVNQRLVNSIHGGVVGSTTWLFKADGEWTHVALIIEYAMPTPFIQRHGINAIEKENKSVAISLLETLKTTMEKTTKHIMVINEVEIPGS